MNPLQEAKTLVSLFILVWRLRPQVAHLITIKPNLYGGVVARLLRVPSVTFAVTGLGHLYIGRRTSTAVVRSVVNRLLRFSLNHSNSRVIFQNPDDRKYLVERGVTQAARAVVILGSGVDLSRFVVHPEPAGPPVVILGARLIWDKGVEEFVAAARILKAQGVVGRFVLAGDTQPSNPRSVPSATIQGWVDEGVLEWWGYRSDMEVVLAAASVVCLPSTYGEGVPKILLEAAASGRPIVTTDLPGCRETVRDGVTGVLTRPGDVNGIADALRGLLEDPGLRRRMGEAGRKLAEERFDDLNIARQTLRVYEQLSEQKPVC